MENQEGRARLIRDERKNSITGCTWHSFARLVEVSDVTDAAVIAANTPTLTSGQVLRKPDLNQSSHLDRNCLVAQRATVQSDFCRCVLIRSDSRCDDFDLPMRSDPQGRVRL